MKKAAERMKVKIEQDGANPDTTVLRTSRRRLFPAPRARQGGRIVAAGREIGEEAIPPDKRDDRDSQEARIIGKTRPDPQTFVKPNALASMCLSRNRQE